MLLPGGRLHRCDWDPIYIPRDTSVVISPYTLQRRPAFFSGPACFDPERFAVQSEKTSAYSAFIPFSVGPRVCPGMHFALLEGRLILAALTQRWTFEFEGPAPLVPDPLLTLRPKGAVLLRVKRR